MREEIEKERLVTEEGIIAESTGGDVCRGVNGKVGRIGKNGKVIAFKEGRLDVLQDGRERSIGEDRGAGLADHVKDSWDMELFGDE